MIFGPRVFRVHGNSIRQQELSLLRTRYRFQTKYTVLILTAVIGGFLLFLLPAYFFNDAKLSCVARSCA
jgi:hypothetical protein